MTDAPASFKNAFRLHRPLIIFTCAYSALVIVLAFALGAKGGELLEVLKYIFLATLSSFLFPMLILLFYLGKAALHAKRDLKYPFHVLEKLDEYWMEYCRSGRLHNALVTVLALFPLSVTFCVGKSLIPHLVPYYLDPSLAALDKLVHFGRYPHEYIVPLIEKNNLAAAMDGLYLSWFMVVYLVTEFATWADDNINRRMRFLWTYCLCWALIGNVMAAALSSVGPIYFHEFFYETSPYLDLLDHLREQNEQAGMKLFILADQLRAWAQDGAVVNINAISAMPSLHVGFAAFLCFYFWRVNKLATVPLVIHFLIIMTGSVYLGWHYAIDGYVGVLAAWAIWLASGPLQSWMNSKTPVKK